MKILSVVGARPNFMKVAPILAAIRKNNQEDNQTGSEFIQHILVHTGQHYDKRMSEVFFADLDLPPPDIHLGVGSGSHAVQTAEIMKRFEEVLLRESPDVVVVVGDVNSTLACALVAAKISFDSPANRPLLAHVEAGLRSFDCSMPEEYNRKLTDHLCDILFVTEKSAIKNLRKEGIPSDKIHFVGNTMIDSVLALRQKAEASSTLDELGLRRRESMNGSGDSITRYALLTLHRPSNVDNPRALQHILDGLQELTAGCPIIFPAHPRTQSRIRQFGLESYFTSVSLKQDGLPGAIRLLDPLGYLDFLCLMKHAALVVTDSGGIQEETTCLGIPCVTVRENTERPLTVTTGTNRIAGTRTAGIREAIRHQLARKARNRLPEKWDGKSAARIVEVILAEVENRRLL